MNTLRRMASAAWDIFDLFQAARHQARLVRDRTRQAQQIARLEADARDRRKASRW